MEQKEDSNKIMVRITSKLNDSKTQRIYRLDGSGHMLSMQGSVFPVEYNSNNYVTIRNKKSKRNFAFHKDDVWFINEEESVPLPKSELFIFDPKQLDL